MAVAETSLKKNSTILKAYKKRAIEQARNGLMDFTLYTNPRYETGWFNELLCAELDNFLREVEEGKMPRLMIFAPRVPGRVNWPPGAFRRGYLESTLTGT